MVSYEFDSPPWCLNYQTIAIMEWAPEQGGPGALPPGVANSSLSGYVYTFAFYPN